MQGSEQMLVNGANGVCVSISELELLPKKQDIEGEDNKTEDKSAQPQTVYQNNLNKNCVDIQSLENNNILATQSDDPTKIKKRELKLVQKAKELYNTTHVPSNLCSDGQDLISQYTKIFGDFDEISEDNLNLLASDFEKSINELGKILEKEKTQSNHLTSYNCNNEESLELFNGQIKQFVLKSFENNDSYSLIENSLLWRKKKAKKNWPKKKRSKFTNKPKENVRSIENPEELDKTNKLDSSIPQQEENNKLSKEIDQENLIFEFIKSNHNNWLNW